MDVTHFVTLTVFNGSSDHSESRYCFNLQHGVNVVGSSETCDIVLPFADIAPEHCIINYNSPGNYTIDDLGGPTGVYLASPQRANSRIHSNEEYSIFAGQPFFLNNKYKCVLEETRSSIRSKSRERIQSPVSNSHSGSRFQDEEEFPVKRSLKKKVVHSSQNQNQNKLNRNVQTFRDFSSQEVLTNENQNPFRNGDLAQQQGSSPEGSHAYDGEPSQGTQNTASFPSNFGEDSGDNQNNQNVATQIVSSLDNDQGLRVNNEGKIEYYCTFGETQKVVDPAPEEMVIEEENRNPEFPPTLLFTQETQEEYGVVNVEATQEVIQNEPQEMIVEENNNNQEFAPTLLFTQEIQEEYDAGMASVPQEIRESVSQETTVEDNPQSESPSTGQQEIQENYEAVNVRGTQETTGSIPRETAMAGEEEKKIFESPSTLHFTQEIQGENEVRNIGATQETTESILREMAVQEYNNPVFPPTLLVATQEVHEEYEVVNPIGGHIQREVIMETNEHSASLSTMLFTQEVPGEYQPGNTGATQEVAQNELQEVTREVIDTEPLEMTVDENARPEFRPTEQQEIQENYEAGHVRGTQETRRSLPKEVAVEEKKVSGSPPTVLYTQEIQDYEVRIVNGQGESQATYHFTQEVSEERRFSDQNVEVENRTYVRQEPSLFTRQISDIEPKASQENPNKGQESQPMEVEDRPLPATTQESQQRTQEQETFVKVWFSKGKERGPIEQQPTPQFLQEEEETLEQILFSTKKENTVMEEEAPRKPKLSKLTTEEEEALEELLFGTKEAEKRNEVAEAEAEYYGEDRGNGYSYDKENIPPQGFAEGREDNEERFGTGREEVFGQSPPHGLNQNSEPSSERFSNVSSNAEIRRRRELKSTLERLSTFDDNGDYAENNVTENRASNFSGENQERRGELEFINQTSMKSEDEMIDLIEPERNQGVVRKPEEQENVFEEEEEEWNEENEERNGGVSVNLSRGSLGNEGEEFEGYEEDESGLRKYAERYEEEDYQPESVNLSRKTSEQTSELSSDFFRKLIEQDRGNQMQGRETENNTEDGVKKIFETDKENSSDFLNLERKASERVTDESSDFLTKLLLESQKTEGKNNQNVNNNLSRKESQKIGDESIDFLTKLLGEGKTSQKISNVERKVSQKSEEEVHQFLDSSEQLGFSRKSSEKISGKESQDTLLKLFEPQKSEEKVVIPFLVKKSPEKISPQKAGESRRESGGFGNNANDMSQDLAGFSTKGVDLRRGADADIEQGRRSSKESLRKYIPKQKVETEQVKIQVFTADNYQDISFGDENEDEQVENLEVKKETGNKGNKKKVVVTKPQQKQKQTAQSVKKEEVKKQEKEKLTRGKTKDNDKKVSKVSQRHLTVIQEEEPRVRRSPIKRTRVNMKDPQEEDKEYEEEEEEEKVKVKKNMKKETKPSVTTASTRSQSSKSTKGTTKSKKEKEKEEEKPQVKTVKGAKSRMSIEVPFQGTVKRKEKPAPVETKPTTKRAPKRKLDQVQRTEEEELQQPKESLKKIKLTVPETRGRKRSSSKKRSPSAKKSEEKIKINVKNNKTPNSKQSSARRSDESSSQKQLRSASQNSDRRVSRSGGHKPRHYVAFTGFNEGETDEDQVELSRLGVKVVDGAQKDFNILVMDNFKRTVKFLLAINKGADVVSYKWVKDCIKRGEILGLGNYTYPQILIDRTLPFDLQDSLKMARKAEKGIFDGYKFYFGEGMKLPLNDLRLLVESADGRVLKTKPKTPREDTFVVIAPNDKKTLLEMWEKGFKIHSPEFVFNSVMRQFANPKDHLYARKSRDSDVFLVHGE